MPIMQPETIFLILGFGAGGLFQIIAHRIWNAGSSVFTSNDIKAIEMELDRIDEALQEEQMTISQGDAFGDERKAWADIYDGVDEITRIIRQRPRYIEEYPKYSQH